MNRVRPSIKGLASYIVPQDRVRVKLNQNESPYDLPPAVKEEILQRLSRRSWNRYPPACPDILIQKLARYTEVAPARLAVGNGSNELIQAVMSTFADPGERIVFTQPGFSVYGRVATVLGLESHSVPLGSSFAFDPDLIIQQSRTAKVVFLSSPNNPTGNSLDPGAAAHIASRLSGILVMDEAYFEFASTSTFSLLERFSNLLILRTFSKALGLAGLRLGYLIGREDLATQIKKAMLPFSVGLAQQTAGEVVLENIHYLKEASLRILKERDLLIKGLEEIPGVQVFPSDANFVLIRCGSVPADTVFSRLKRQSVLVRSFESPDLKDMLRVTVGAKEENSVLLEELKKIFSENES